MKYTPTNERTSSGSVIYLATCETTGIQRYRVKCRQMVIAKGKAKFVPGYRELDPIENEGLFSKHPERFSAYIRALLRQSMVKQ